MGVAGNDPERQQKKEPIKMSTTQFANGSRPVQHSSHAAALADCLATWPDMVTHSDGHRTLVWRNEAESENDDGQNAVAEISVS